MLAIPSRKVVVLPADAGSRQMSDGPVTLMVNRPEAVAPAAEDWKFEV